MSELLRAEKLSFRRGAALVLREVSLTLSSGEHVGLVGANGAGKSTLLALLAGTLQGSEGELRRAPGARIGYLQQAGAGLRGTLWAAAQGGLEHVRGLEAALRAAETQLGQPGGLERYGDLTEAFERAGGYEAEATLQAHLSRLGFGLHDYERDTASLSGGERARLALARVLAERPDLLLLDEPSSYLDLPTRRWLTDTLASYPGALLLASHDRALLDATTRRTLQLEHGAVTSYRGGYSRFAAQRAHASTRLSRVAARSAHERRALAARIQSQPTLSTRRSLERRLARLPQIPGYRTAKTPALTLEAPPAPTNRVLLEARNLSLSHPAHMGQLQPTLLLDDVSLRVYSGDKLALVGPNGAGKTSLLRLLAGDLEPDPAPETVMQLGGAPVRLAAGVKLAVFDQHGRGLEDGVPLGEQLGRSVSEPRAHSLLALVGLPDSFEALPETLSGGQRARAGVALLLAAEADLLLLDEPSEQLDVAMLETLETALADTGAALVFSSHDAALVDAVATRVLGLSEGKLLEYRGGLAGYYAGTLRLEPDLPEPDTAADNATDSATDADPEAELAALEDETAAVEELLADPLRLSERDRGRLTKRLHDLIDLRSERYDARLPAPRPRYRALEGGLYVSTDGLPISRTMGPELTGSVGMGHPTAFSSDAGLTVHLYIKDAQLEAEPNRARRRIGHLVLQPDPARCTLPWAETAVIRGAVRLAFEVLGVQAVQLQRARDLSAAGLEAAGEDWWLLSLEGYLSQEGWLCPAHLEPPTRGRKLVYADDWQRWAKRRKARRKAQAKPQAKLQPSKPAK